MHCAFTEINTQKQPAELEHSMQAPSITSFVEMSGGKVLNSVQNDEGWAAGANKRC